MFNKNYWIRRFDEQREVKGYLTSGSRDFAASLHIHPLGTDSIQALPEGLRHLKRLEGHGEIELFTANEEANRKGDLLYYHGDWYECINCQLWHTTLLSHYNYQFVIVPVDSGGTIDLHAPNGEPVNKTEGEGDKNETA